MHQSWRYILNASLDQQPSAGRLGQLCEENYLALERLLPNMREMQGCYRSSPDGHAALHLEVLEHARYTSLVHLTYYFDAERGVEPDPDVTIRVYHDAQEAEVIDLKQSQLPIERLFEAPGLRNKWQANLFLSKWLDYCRQQRHRFARHQSSTSLESTSV